MNDSAFIKNIASLVDCNRDALQSLRSMKIESSTTGRGYDISKSGYRSEFICIMLEGWAARYSLRSDGSRRITGFLLPGDFCGIHAVCQSAMDHSIGAITSCVVGRVHVNVVQKIIDDYPEIGRAFWQAKLRDEISLRAWLVVADDALHSISYLLCEIFEKLGALKRKRTDFVTLPITQTHIGDALGLTAVHVNRTLRRMREMGLIDTKGRALRVLDVARLKNVAGF
ncbi:Crp/Fnr family transcriptional regulator [Sphingomonas sp. SAFR-052]|uniref:Crp/Fnr family transcriptional regulator n=1 Tax=Sphingomonas sp. SAFR-052 TaxID=3436867 RepID=UPI003F7D831D